MNISVVDDDKCFREQITGYIKKYFAENRKEQCLISEFENGMDFVSDYNANCDIVFLDIEMPHMDGMEAARRIRCKDDKVVIVFITNISKYAIKGYEVGAIDFVLKPIEYFNFADKLQKAIACAGKHREETTFIKCRDGLVKLSYRDITYIEKDHNNIVYHVTNNKYSSIGSLMQIEEELSKQFFFKINSGCMVNLRHIERVDKNAVYLNGEMLPIARGRQKELVNAMFEYMFGRGK
jgi:DNA-binding LytR/AlgR family response regulator